MGVFSVIFSVFILLSPLFFWMYILQSFPNLGIGRKQFLIGILVGAASTLPLIYSDFWILGNIIESIFFSFSYISESFFALDIFIRIFGFFLFFFLIGAAYIYYKTQKFETRFLRICLGYTALIALSTSLIYGFYLVFGNRSGEVSITSGDYVFQGFGLIFGYYIIISILEEGLKYFGNTQAVFGNNGNFYRVIGFACTLGLGFAFFENIFYSYSLYITTESLDGLMRLIFFRSIFTVSLHILCAILLAAGMYFFSTQIKNKRNKILLILLGGGAVLSHAFFDVALSYGYMGVMFFYIFALYVTIVHITTEGGAVSS